jgi:integrase
MKVRNLTADICRKYAKERVAQGKSGNTVGTELTRLRSCINWAKAHNEIERKPYIWVPMKPRPEKKPLTLDEIHRLLDACIMPHLRIFTALALSTAGRQGAILELKWDQCDFEKSTIDLRIKEVVKPLFKRVRKGRAIVPMTDEMRAMLQDAKAGALTNYVIEWNGKPVKKIRRGFMEAAKRAGLPRNVTPHTLRHTLASMATDADVSMLKISRFLGHKDSRTTETIYSKSSVDSLKDVSKVVRLQKRSG